MKIVVEMSDDNQKRELSITDGTVTFRTKNCFLMKHDMLQIWIKSAFDTWLELYFNQQRCEEENENSGKDNYQIIIK